LVSASPRLEAGAAPNEASARRALAASPRAVPAVPVSLADEAALLGLEPDDNNEKWMARGAAPWVLLGGAPSVAVLVAARPAQPRIEKGLRYRERFTLRNGFPRGPPRV
jgi:hypothetical protein